MTLKKPLGWLLCAALFAQAPAHAFLGSDSEAVEKLGKQTDERLQKLEGAQFGLANEAEALKAEVAKLRGQVEVLTHELQQALKRQQDFYVDLDSRLRRLEPQVQGAAEAGGAPAGTGSGVAAGSLGRDSAVYEAALDLFKAGKYAGAQSGFTDFLGAFPNSSLAPNAQYWLGNTYYAQNDCNSAIAAQRQVISRWPDSDKAPDAMLVIATCQQAMGKRDDARHTLNSLVEKYPGSPAAVTAKKRR